MWHFITEYADTLLNAGLELLLKSTALLTLAFAITLAARKTSAAAKHMLWTAVMAILLALPLIIALAPQWQILPRRQAAITPTPRLTQPTHTIALAMPDPLPSTPDARRPQATRAPLATNKPTPPTLTPPLQLPWQLYPLLLYLLGTLLTLSPMLIALAWFHRLQRTARPLTTWNPLLADARRLLNTRRPITLLESPQLRMPMTFGTLHPRILLPAEATTWPTEKRRLVLLHETAHILRLDVLTHTLANLVRALYWPHPLVWLAHRQMTLEAERAADDDRVLLATHESATYARTLIEVAAGLNEKHTLIGGIAMARKSTLETRIRSVMHDHTNRRGVSALHLLAATLLALGVGLPLGMLRAVPANDTTTAAPPNVVTDTATLKHFSTGETIELLGITHDQQGPWWRVDGGPMIPPLGVRGSRDMSEDNVYLLKMTGVSEGSEPVADTQDQKELKRLQKMETAAVDGSYYTVSQNRQLPTLRIGTGKGEWKTEIQTHWGESAKSDNGQIAIGQPRALQHDFPETATGVVIAYTFDPRKIEWRLAALDKEEKEHYAIRPDRAASFPPLRQEELYFRNVVPDQVQSLRFETRPREWIQFEGFIANPGMPAAAEDLAAVQKRLAERRSQLEQASSAQSKALQAKRTAELESATAKSDAVTIPQAAPPPGNYYIMGGARPGVYQLPTQKLTILQAVVSSGITQSDLTAVRIQVVRQHDGKTEFPLQTTLQELVTDSGSTTVLPGDVIWIKDLSALRDQEAKLKDTISDLTHEIDRYKKSPSARTGAAQQNIGTVEDNLIQTQQKLDQLITQENER